MENERKDSMPFLQKVGYGVGDLGANFCWTFVASFILIYCTDILGVSAAMIGTLMAFSKILDGISDIFMGRIIDCTKSKMGKARFWLFVSSFPVAFSVFLLFNVPATFTENTKYIYVFIVYTLMGAVFYTMNNIAYSTLNALVTKNTEDRVAMGSYRFIFAILAVILISSFTSSLVDQFGGGQEGWRAVSIIYAAICLIGLLIPVAAVRELPESELNEVEKNKAKEKDGFFKAFLFLLKNKYFVLILIHYLVSYLATGIYQGFGIYYTTYCLGNPGLLGAISMASMLPTVIVLPFVPKLTEKFGLRKFSLVTGIIALGGGILVFVGGKAGLYSVLMVGMIVKAAFSAPMTGGLNTFIAETADYSELKFGKQMTATIYSCSSVGIKVGTGLGTAVCGFLLDIGKYDGMAEVQADSAIKMIQNSYLFSFVLIVLMSVITLIFLKVQEENKQLREQKLAEK